MRFKGYLHIDRCPNSWLTMDGKERRPRERGVLANSCQQELEALNLD